MSNLVFSIDVLAVTSGGGGGAGGLVVTARVIAFFGDVRRRRHVSGVSGLFPVLALFLGAIGGDGWRRGVAAACQIWVCFQPLFVLRSSRYRAMNSSRVIPASAMIAWSVPRLIWSCRGMGTTASFFTRTM